MENAAIASLPEDEVEPASTSTRLQGLSSTPGKLRARFRIIIGKHNRALGFDTN